MQFTKKNYTLLAVSVALILLGFLLMSGGGPKGSTDFNPEIFSARRIVVAPIVSLVGFVLVVYAILAKPKKKKDNNAQ